MADELDLPEEKAIEEYKEEETRIQQLEESTDEESRG